MQTQQKKDTDERKVRLEKLNDIKEAGINPYPAKYNKQDDLSDAINKKEDSAVKSAGRLMTIRVMGKIIFAHIQDATSKMQIVIKQDVIGQKQYKLFTKKIDIGDFIGVEGKIFTTKKGEISILVEKYVFLGKALLPLPEKWHGLKNEEARHRQRYLDLLMNEKSRNTFAFRHKFIKALREFYWKNGFDEVETSTLLHKATGATAKPYKTHNNALDIDVHLRISHELPLKELIVGGYERVFELGKAFRNEGADPSHLPEHTHLEHYSAYWNYEDNIIFTEKMFDYLFNELCVAKEMLLTNREGEQVKVNWSTPWPRVDFVKQIKKDCDLDITAYSDAKKLLLDIKKRKIEFDGMNDMSLSGLVDNLYKKVSRPKIVNPTVLINYPKYMQPLARISDKDSSKVEQFQLVVNGWEIVRAYSELVDPIDQRERFEYQTKAKNAGEEETMEGDDEYIAAMEHGMPPISGWGMGVDRIVALLTGNPNLRDVVLFPLMRPRDIKNVASSDRHNRRKKNKKQQ